MNTNHTMLKKLRWQCRRGMLELDLILLPFLEKEFLNLKEDEQNLFIELLQATDQDLYVWLVGKAQPSEDRFIPIISKILKKSHD